MQGRQMVTVIWLLVLVLLVVVCTPADGSVGGSAGDSAGTQTKPTPLTLSEQQRAGQISSDHDTGYRAPAQWPEQPSPGWDGN